MVVDKKTTDPSFDDLKRDYDFIITNKCYTGPYDEFSKPCQEFVNRKNLFEEIFNQSVDPLHLLTSLLRILE